MGVLQMNTTTITSCSYTKNVTKVTWKINNFSIETFRNDLNYCLSSELFKLDKSRLNFFLTFRHTTIKQWFEKDRPMIYLMPFDLNSEVQLNYKCHIENSAHKKVGKQPENKCTFNEAANRYENQKFAEYNNWFLFTNDFAKNGETIEIHCEIERICNKRNFEPVELDGNCGLRLFEAHQKDSEIGLSVIEVGNERFKADRSILMMHSSVFTLMLKSDLVKEKGYVIQMKDYNSIAVKTFLASLYAGYILNTVFVDDLIVLADVYNVQWMKREAELILSNDLSIQNVFKRLHLASNYSCPLLKNKLVHFASKTDHFEKIIQHNDWNQLALKDKPFAYEILNLGFEKLRIKAKLSESKKNEKKCFKFF